MNESGIWPIGYKVLVKQREVEEKTSGGIILVDDTKERQQLAEQEGILIALGSSAFEEEPKKPVHGAKVVFHRYAGGTVYVEGTDGKDYKLMNDSEILAVRE